MEIDVSGEPIGDLSAETIAVAVPEPADPIPDALEDLWALVASGEAPAARGVARLVHVDGRRVVAAGVGPRGSVDPDAVRDAAAAAARELAGTVGGSVAWLVDPAL